MEKIRETRLSCFHFHPDHAGCVGVDIEKLKKIWMKDLKRWIIVKWKEEYRIVHLWRNSGTDLKITVPKNVAEKLISDLILVYVPSTSFKEAGEFVSSYFEKKVQRKKIRIETSKKEVYFEFLQKK